MTDYDTTRKVEETEIGYRTTIKSKRGTGTRDQDEVRVEARTETYPDPTLLRRMEDDVTMLMNDRRAHDPDGDGDE